MPLHKLPENFDLENGVCLQHANLHYEILGEFSESKQVIWICHAFTGSATVIDWWPSLFKSHGGFIDLDLHVVICANMLGSCYGSTGPESIHYETGNKYGSDFPEIHNRDIIKSFIHLRRALGIDQIDFLIGGSLGGQQVLQWTILEPDVIQHQVIIAGNARHSAWGIAFNDIQRRALNLGSVNDLKQLDEALSLARSIAMISYRSYQDFELNQVGKRADGEWKAATYLTYQGQKFISRFSPLSYILLSKMLDTHDISNGRQEDMVVILNQIQCKTLAIGIDTDILFPPHEQKFIADHIPNASFEILHSTKGHDAFLLEGNKISALIQQHFLNQI